MSYLQLRAGSGTSGTDLMIVSKSYEGNKMTDLKPNDTAGQPPASQENPHKPSDKYILNPSGMYLFVIWCDFLPSLVRQQHNQVFL